MAHQSRKDSSSLKAIFLLGLIASTGFAFYPFNVFLFPSFLLAFCLHGLLQEKNHLGILIKKVGIFIIASSIPIFLFDYYLRLQFDTSFLDSFRELQKIYGHRFNLNVFYYPFRSHALNLNMALFFLMASSFLLNINASFTQTQWKERFSLFAYRSTGILFVLLFLATTYQR